MHIVKHNDHTVNLTLMVPKWTRKLGQPQSSIVIATILRQPVHQLSKRLPDNSTIFAAEATTMSLALNYYQYMGPVHLYEVYPDSLSCLQAMKGEDTQKPFICHILTLLWSLSDKGTHCLCLLDTKPLWHEGSEGVDQLAKETLGHCINPHTCAHYADSKSLENSYVSISWNQHWGHRRNSRT